MGEYNGTSIVTILLLGFQLPPNLTFLVFCVLLLISGVTICGNLLIIKVVAYSKTLHTPMYFFLSQLSLLDIILVMDILPSMQYSLLSKKAIISFSACITQLYFLAVSENVESLLLSVMSYDRYLAICKPLHYNLIMTKYVCWRLVITCWILAIIILLTYILTVLNLQFCGPNIIDHFFCDLDPVLELSCTSSTIVQIEAKLIGAVDAVIPFCVITVSYIYIIVTIFDIQSTTIRKKVFSTCSSHLTVVSVFYGALVSVYMVPHRGQSRYIAKFLSLLYTVVTPLMNPIIYSLRNKELKNAITKLNTGLFNVNFNSQLQLYSMFTLRKSKP
ncbi:olfactory receptor 1M1-like [Gastrophryne carolinensis]